MIAKVLKIREALKKGETFLKERGIEAYSLEAQLLMAYALGRSRAFVLAEGEKVLEKDEEDKFFALIQKRGSRYPLAYILGKKDFMGLELKITPAVLIPRSDTEVLAEEVLRRLDDEPKRVVDVGTGSGAIALALKFYRPSWEVWATDLSEAALEVAGANAQSYNLELNFKQSDLLSSLSGKFDLIVSNPPYVTSTELKELQPEVRFEPLAALDGGEDGLMFYRRLIPQAASFLKEEGTLFSEIGSDLAEKIKELFSVADWSSYEIIPDYQHRPRVIIAQKREKSVKNLNKRGS